MNEPISTSQDLSFSACVFTACLCTLFGANAVAIKISLAGLGVFTTAGLRFAIAAGAAIDTSPGDLVSKLRDLILDWEGQ